jgi:hypothetical protein
MAQENQEQIIIEKAMRDASFRQRLLSDPRRALQEEFGITAPADVHIHVHEETPRDVHIVIPPAESGGMRELSDADLESAVGGMMISGNDKTNCCTCGASTAQTFSSWQKGCGC